MEFPKHNLPHGYDDQNPGPNITNDEKNWQNEGWLCVRIYKNTPEGDVKYRGDKIVLESHGNECRVVEDGSALRVWTM